MENFNPFKFSGRMGRLQFFWFGLIWGAVAFALSRAVGASGGAPTHGGGGAAALYVVLAVVSIIATFSYGIRRLHDFDRSGWWYLLMFVPIVNFVLGLVLLFTPGSPGSNRHGVRA